MNIDSSAKHYHLKDTISLSIPLILTQVGYVLTGMIDNIFLGKLGKTEQAVGVFSNSIFIVILVFSIGVSYVLTPAISSAHSVNNEKEKASLFKNSLYLNLGMAIILFATFYFVSPLLYYIGQPFDVIKLAEPFLNVLIFSLIPAVIFFVCKQYSEGLGITKYAMYFSIIGNVLNIILNYCLIYGKMGLPEMGYMGSCWATFFSRLLVGLGFLYFLFNNKNVNSFSMYFSEAKINTVHFLMLLKDGLSSALQFTFEITAFSIAGIMAGSFGKEQIDAHGIALSLSSFTYMFSSGISSATTIRTSRFYTLNEMTNFKKAIKTSYMMSIFVMGFMAIGFILFNKYLPKIFTNDIQIISISSHLLIFVAFFQLFDGIQITSIGILRGIKDYKYPTNVAFIVYWLLSIPLSYFLSFVCDYKVFGVWLALSFSLFVVSIVLYFRVRFLTSNNKKNLL